MKMALLGMAMLTGFVGVARADAPRVVADIAPIHALVARVMQGVGTPELLIRPEVSPHDYAMRPSEAHALQEAEVVFWTGHILTPRLEKTIETVAHSAQSVVLSEIQGITLLEFRQNAIFGDEDMHDDDADHHVDEEGHDHGSIDPHIWLDPENARLIVVRIAEVLAEIDPPNAELYATNAIISASEIQAQSAEISDMMAPVKDREFLVFHDAYHYFENRFGLEATGAVLVSDAATPSAGRLTELRSIVAENNVVCVFSEPQFNPKVLQAVTEGAQVKTAELDPMGVKIAAGAGLYSKMLHKLAATMVECLKG